MKTVVENNEGMIGPYFEKKHADHYTANEFRKGKSCFYDFAAENFADFSEFVKGDGNEFIRQIGKIFRSE